MECSRQYWFNAWAEEGPTVLWRPAQDGNLQQTKKKLHSLFHRAEMRLLHGEGEQEGLTRPSPLEKLPPAKTFIPLKASQPN